VPLVHKRESSVPHDKGFEEKKGKMWSLSGIEKIRSSSRRGRLRGEEESSPYNAIQWKKGHSVVMAYGLFT